MCHAECPRWVSLSLNPILQPSLSDENRLRDHAVDALGAVDHLGDVIVHRNARDHVGLLARELREALSDEKDGLPHRHLHRFLKVRVEAHGDPMGRGLGARPGELQVLAHDELEFAAQRGSMAGRSTSPWPWAAWASPIENSAPGA